MSKWTPGQWRVGWGRGLTGPRAAPLAHLHGGIAVIPVRSGEDVVALIVESIGPERHIGRVGPTELMKADADLIAAAPAMYEALKNFNFSIPPDDAPCHRNLCSQDECPNCQREIAAVKALAQAEGWES